MSALATRTVITVFGIGAALIALSGVEIVAIDNLGMGVMSVLFAGILAIFWSKTRRAAGLPGLLVGGAVFVVRHFVLGEPAFFGEESVEAAVPATLAAVATIAVLSYLLDESKRSSVEEVQREATQNMNRFTRDELTSDN